MVLPNEHTGSEIMKDNINLKKWALRCPICATGRLIDVTDEIAPDKILLFCGAEVVRGQLASKCPKCKNQIGITIK